MQEKLPELERPKNPKEIAFLRSLTAVGFSPDEVEAATLSINFENISKLADMPKSKLFSDEFLHFVSTSLDRPQDVGRRNFFLKAYLSGYPSNEDTSISVTSFLHKTKPNSNLRSDFSIFLRKITNEEKLGFLSFGQMIYLGSEVLQNNFVYKLFDFDINYLSRFAKINVPGALPDLGRLVNLLAASPFGEKLVQGTSPAMLIRLRGMRNIYDIVINQELTDLFKNFLAGEATWVDKFSYVKPVMKATGVSYLDINKLEGIMIGQQISNLSKTGKWNEEELTNAARDLSSEEREGLNTRLVKEAKGYDDLGTFFVDKIRDLQNKNSILANEWAEEENLDRVKRRESPWNPLNSLDIAKTVGYELEFMIPATSSLLKAERLLNNLGFKKGDGGGGYTETSPGPFYDPYTANLAFRQYINTGLLNFYDSERMTIHFNAGIEMAGMRTLIRALHLTGAGINPKYKFRKDYLLILRNSQNGIYYTESKVFDGTTRGEFEWNMKASSYLSWALGAQQEFFIKNGMVKGREWKRQLAIIWQKYVATLKGGLAVVGITNYLKNPNNNSFQVGKVIKQLDYIFSVPDARYGKLKQIDKSHNSEILGITFGNKKWPNIANFARDITNDAVSQIESLADNVELQAKMDINRIENIKGPDRVSAMSAFLEKYGYMKLMESEKTGVVEAYSKVKETLS